MKRLFFILSIIPLFLQAAPVDKTTAMRVAQTFWWNEYKQTATFNDYSGLIGLNNIYLFAESNNRGYIVVSADDIACPVLGYSQKPFLTENICPSIISWLQSYDNQISAAREAGYKADEFASREWDALLSGESLPESKAAVTVTPILTSIWNQSEPYNLYCPGEGSNKAPTGCVATAMAQVMHYWNYPEHGIGQNSYNYADFTDTNFNWTYGTLSADFENTYYDWANMVDTLREDSDSANIKAVALLNYHCGIALNMLYKPGGSMAFVTIEDNILFGENHYPRSIASENVIPGFFGYSSALDGRVRSEFSNVSDWINLLKDDLQKGRPIIFAGAAAEGPSAGHCFIIDGVNTRLFFHVNLGWGGAYDGDFRVDALTVQGSSFNCRQQAIIGMRPPQFSSVEVVCRGAADENSGVFQGQTPVCNSFVGMTNGDSESVLNIEAGEGQIIGAIIVNNEVVFNYGSVLNPENLTVQSQKNISYDFTTIEDDVKLKVIFDTDDLAIDAANRNASNLVVYAKDNNIMMRGTNVGKGSIYDTMGRKVADFDGKMASALTIPMPHAGIYIVRINGESHKVVVRR